MHLYCFSPRTLSAILRRAGFENVLLETTESYTTKYALAGEGSLTRGAATMLVIADRALGTGAKLIADATPGVIAG